MYKRREEKRNKGKECRSRCVSRRVGRYREQKDSTESGRA